MTLYKVKLTPLTPVHIGNGEDIYPYEYKIFQMKKGGFEYFRFNPTVVLGNLPEKELEEFSKCIEDMVKLRVFFFNRVQYSDSPDIMLHPPVPASELAYKHFRENIQQRQNALELRPFIRPSGGNAYIPGSTLKGALRGAWLHEEWKKQNRGVDIKYTHDHKGHVQVDSPRFCYEPGELLGIGDPKELITRDPFKIFKVGDSFEELPTSIMVAMGVQWDKKEGQMTHLGAVQTLTEYLPGSLTNGAASSVYHRVKVDEVARDGWQLTVKLTWNNVVERIKPLTSAILAADVEFYAKGGPEYRDALNTTHAVTQVHEESMDKAHVCVTRIGWGSGFDAMSLNTATQDPMFVLSRKLADGRWPHGWVKLEWLKWQ